MNILLVFSGIWIAMLPRMPWYSIEFKKLNIANYCIGIYTALLGVLRMIDMKIIDELCVLALTTSIILGISTIILKLKGEKNILDIAAIVSSVALLIGAILIAIIEIEELTSSVIMITGALLLLSISYKSISTK